MSKRPVEDIVASWQHECGLIKQGKSGPYRMIPFEGKKDHLLNLAQTLIDEGYDEETMKSVSTRNLVVKYCCPPEKSGVKSLKKQQEITAEQWKYVLYEFYRAPIKKFVAIDRTHEYVQPIEEKEIVKEPEYEMNPSDMIKVDPNAEDMVLDHDFLNAIAMISGKAHEENE